VVRDHRLLLIEDCAQAFAGCQAYTGHPEADVSMFSFGPIKTSTAMGGALFRVKDPELLARLQLLESRLPTQPRWRHSKRLAKYILIRLLTGPRVWGIIGGYCQQRNIQYDPVVVRLARAFAGPQGLFASIRFRPPTPMLALLRRRLQRFDQTALRRREANAHRLARLLSPRLSLAGSAATLLSYWLCPVVCHHRDALIPSLRREGFDASCHHTLGVVPTKTNHAGNTRATALLQSLLFVPAGAELPEEAIQHLAQSLLRLSDAESGQSPPPTPPKKHRQAW
jgi:dTDP-4-amino-4,6-dideoxygalactose transaminase